MPVDAPGITLVARALNAGSDSEWEAPISSHDELAETFTIFNDVFIPTERVFLLGEWEAAGDIANMFASVNRQGYLGTESGKLRLFIGAAQRIAELNGVSDVGHIRDKVAQLIRMERAIWALGVAASHESFPASPGSRSRTRCSPTRASTCAWRAISPPAGCCWRSPAGRSPRAADRGPSRAGHQAAVEKYLRGAEPGSAWERIRVFKLIRDLAASEYSGYWNTEIIHGSGSPAAEVLAMYRETDLEACKALVARALTGRAAILGTPTAA